jgi:probable phosphoglycerate mutase
LFVRHAEVRNPRGVVYGRLPRFGLSARGRAQAARVAEWLADEPLRGIYTSPLLRARQTTEVIARHHPGVPVRRSSLLLEIRTSWQGTPNKDVPKGTSFYVDRRHEKDEVVADVLARMQRLVRWLLRRHPGETVVCVSHADPIAILTLWSGGHEVTPELLQQPLAPARGAITLFEHHTPDAPPVLTYINPQDPEPEEAKSEQRAESEDGAAGAPEPGPESAAGPTVADGEVGHKVQV